MTRNKRSEELARLIEGIVTSHPEISSDDCSPEARQAIIRGMISVENVLRELSQLKQREGKVRAQYDAGMADIAKRRNEIREECPHWSTTYSRPTAECEPETRCNVCGALVK